MTTTTITSANILFARAGLFSLSRGDVLHVYSGKRHDKNTWDEVGNAKTHVKDRTVVVDCSDVVRILLDAGAQVGR